MTGPLCYILALYRIRLRSNLKKPSWGCPPLSRRGLPQTAKIWCNCGAPLLSHSTEKVRAFNPRPAQLCSHTRHAGGGGSRFSPSVSSEPLIVGRRGKGQALNKVDLLSAKVFPYPAPDWGGGGLFKAPISFFLNIFQTNRDIGTKPSVPFGTSMLHILTKQKFRTYHRSI